MVKIDNWLIADKLAINVNKTKHIVICTPNSKSPSPQGSSPWGCISTLFSVIKKRVLSRNFDQSMLKNAYFLEKSTKTASASRAEPPFAYGGWGLCL